MNRQSLFFIIIGTNGTGKTTLLNNILNNSNRKNVLVVDPDGYEWRQYQEIPVDEIDTLNTGNHKILAPTKEEIEYLIEFRNGILVLDDCRYYANKRLENEIRRVLIRRRQNVLDVFAVAQSLSEVPPDFYTFATGGAGQAQTQLPSPKAVEAAVGKQLGNLAAGKIPVPVPPKQFATIPKGIPDVDLTDVGAEVLDMF